MDDWLEAWKLDESQVRDRLYQAPTARERERWHAVWLVARGRSAARVAEALERDAHTIGEWLAVFRERGPAGLGFEHSGGSPRPRRAAAGGGKGGGPGGATGGRDRPGRLELEGRAAVRGRALRTGARSEQLPELPASPGLRAHAAQEAAAEGGPGAPGGVRARVRAAARHRGGEWGEDLLRRRGALLRRRRPAGEMGAEGRAGPGGLDQPALRREGQLLLGGLPGDRGGRGDGARRHELLRDLRRLPPTVARQSRRALDRHLGQRPGPRWRRRARVPGHAGPAAPPGPTARLQPGLQPG